MRKKKRWKEREREEEICYILALFLDRVIFEPRRDAGRKNQVRTKLVGGEGVEGKAREGWVVGVVWLFGALVGVWWCMVVCGLWVMFSPSLNHSLTQSLSLPSLSLFFPLFFFSSALGLLLLFCPHSPPLFTQTHKRV